MANGAAAPQALLGKFARVMRVLRRVSSFLTYVFVGFGNMFGPFQSVAKSQFLKIQLGIFTRAYFYVLSRSI
jgi:hypothetical protein